MLAAAYDPSRDLSPNLPCQDCSDSGSGCSTSSGSSACCKSEFTPCGDCSPEPTAGGRLSGSGGPGSGGGGGGPCPGAALKEDVVCAGCQLRITDRFYLYAVDRRWHASCLQCSQCRAPLDGQVTCFARDGSIFCKKDYYRSVKMPFILSINSFHYFTWKSASRYSCRNFTYFFNTTSIGVFETSDGTVFCFFKLIWF